MTSASHGPEKVGKGLGPTPRLVMVVGISRMPLPRTGLIFCAALLFDAAAAFIPSVRPGLGWDVASLKHPSRTTSAPRVRVASLATSLRASTPATLMEEAQPRGTGMFRGGGQSVVLECEDLKACPADGKAIVFFSGMPHFPPQYPPQPVDVPTPTKNSSTASDSVRHGLQSLLDVGSMNSKTTPTTNPAPTSYSVRHGLQSHVAV